MIPKPNHRHSARPFPVRVSLLALAAFSVLSASSCRSLQGAGGEEAGGEEAGQLPPGIIGGIHSSAAVPAGTTGVGLWLGPVMVSLRFDLAAWRESRQPSAPQPAFDTHIYSAPK